MRRFYPSIFKVLVSFIPAVLVFTYYYLNNFASNTCNGPNFQPDSHFSPITQTCQTYTLTEFINEYARYFIIPYIVSYLFASLLKNNAAQKKVYTHLLTIVVILIISLYAAVFTFVPIGNLLGIPLGFFLPGLGAIVLIAVLTLLYSLLLTLIANKLYLSKFK